MVSDTERFILDYIQTCYTLPGDVDAETLDYVDTGYVDSLEILRFIATLEDEFGIEFTDDELRDPSFKVVGRLAALIERKMENKHEGIKADGHP